MTDRAAASGSATKYSGRRAAVRCLTKKTALLPECARKQVVTICKMNTKAKLLIVAIPILALVLMGVVLKVTYDELAARERGVDVCSASFVKITPQLDDIFLVEAKGTVRKSNTFAAGAEAPGLILVSGKEAHELAFNSDTVRAAAYKVEGRCVSLTGALVEVGGVNMPPRKAIDVHSLTPDP